MNIRHNCGKEKDFELSWVDPTGNTADRIKCNICGREFIDIISIKRLKEKIKLNEEIGLSEKHNLGIEIDKLVGSKLTGANE